MAAFIGQLESSRQLLWLLIAATLMAGSLPMTAWAQQEPGSEGRGRPARAFDDENPPPRHRMRGRGGERAWGPPPPLWNRMSEDEHGHMESFVEEHFPAMYLELERLKERNPERYRHRMNRMAPDMRNIMETLVTQPERGTLMIQSRRLDMQMRTLANKYHRAGKDRKASLRKKFRELSEQAFDSRHRRREMEIRQLEARITELIQRHEEAMKMRNKLIDQTVKDRLDKPSRPARSPAERP